MFFGVPSITPAQAAPETHDAQTLLSVARAAATQLVADLERARQLTDGWANAELIDALVTVGLSKCLHELARTGCWGPSNRLASHELWQIAGPLLECGSLQQRARFKPRGYAGDYEMLHWIVTGRCCEHPLGRAFDRYFLNQAAPAAVRARTEQIAAALAAHCLATDAAGFQVVSVGAGPGSDIHQGLRLLSAERRNRLRITLLDLDPDALEFARQQIEPLLPPGALKCIRENLFRLPRNARSESVVPAADFLVCSGLFDYLDDEAATEMLRLFWLRLAPGGMLLVGNFAPSNPTRAYMEWIGNWYLTYRTAEDLKRLAAKAGIPEGRYSVGSEPLGVDLFLVAARC